MDAQMTSAEFAGMDTASQVRHYATVARAIEFIRQHAPQQPSLESVAEAVHMSPYHLQRVFSEWAGLSPKRFLQYLTKEHAKACLLQSQSVLDVSAEVGLSGPGRLHDLMITSEGMTPGEIQSAGDGLSIGFGVGPSPFGDVFLAWTPRGICQFVFVDQPIDHLSEGLCAAWQRAHLQRDDAQASQWLARIFPRTPKRGQIHLVLRGTNFQIKVWEALMRTRPGQILSYAQVANQIGHPRAHRAVGTALAVNDIGYLIPCHRVIQGSGEVGQYRWRTERKIAIQAWEQGFIQQDKA